MLLTHLKQIVNYFTTKNFHSLEHIKRCNNNVMEVCFDRDYYFYVDLHKGESTLFRKQTPACDNSFSAAFDTMLFKCFKRTKVAGISLVDDDKVLRFDVRSVGSYKEQHFSIQFEFTGRFTNAIILDEHNLVVEALRHIDSAKSSRCVRVGEVLEPIPKAKFTPKEETIKDVEAWLLEVYVKKHTKVLHDLKTQKLAQLSKQRKKIVIERKKLTTREALEQKADVLQKYAEIVTANIYQIKPYEQVLHLRDFEGNAVEIPLDKVYTKPTLIGNDLFAKAKKLKQKAKFLHIEEENLESILSFIDQLSTVVTEAKTVAEVERMMPKQKKMDKKEKYKPYEVFWFENYKVLLGRNAKANQALLEDAKANDMWFHMKDRASAHVLIKSDKQKIPQHIIEQAAKLVVDFSVTATGRFSVDYTKRRELQIQEGANLFYNKYDTIIIQKE